VKVLFIVTAYPRSEADVITPWLLETIQRLRARGTEVEVLAPSYRGLEDQVIAGIRVHRFRYAPRAWETLTHDQTAPDRIRERPIYATLLPGYLLAGSRAAARLARTREFDAVHAFWPLPHGLLGLAAKRAAGIPLVSTFFGVELTWVESQLGALRPLVRRIVRRSDAVTAISTHTASLLRRLAPETEPVIIPFGATVEANLYEPEQEDRLHAGLRMLFVGRLVERKGVHVLLDALALLPEEPPIQLDVVGDGPEREALEHRARSLGVAERVRFHGFVPQEELERQLAECDALVLPAVVDAKGDVEGLGVVLLEAMSFGKPVVASAAGGITDIVRPSENGLLVPPGDAKALAAAIECLARDPALVRRLGAAARRDVAANFSWDSILDRLETVYRRVTDRSPAGGRRTLPRTLDPDG
jgi:glycosyltransferase involved in cell wall biosynthesis